jgi:hypothetical protein
MWLIERPFSFGIQPDDVCVRRPIVLPATSFPARRRLFVMDAFGNITVKTQQATGPLTMTFERPLRVLFPPQMLLVCRTPMASRPAATPWDLPP